MSCLFECTFTEATFVDLVALNVLIVKLYRFIKKLFVFVFSRNEYYILKILLE